MKEEKNKESSNLMAFSFVKLSLIRDSPRNDNFINVLHLAERLTEIRRRREWYENCTQKYTIALVKSIK